ncbi:MAG: hypothetical protein JW741_07615, partial [Sedimentisphaerales bacterium]|nr:hypothetical protein [Sedimentisphaerales bacterium]
MCTWTDSATRRWKRPLTVYHVILFVAAALAAFYAGIDGAAGASSARDGSVVKKALRLDQSGENLLKPDGWTGWQRGFTRDGDVFVCDNGADTQAQRGVSQTVTLNQQKPEPIIATAWSRAENVGGTRDRDYCLYLDLRYTDGTPLWGQVDSWSVGTHDWEKAQVIVFPEKPVASVSFHMLLRGHSGKAWFRDPQLQTVHAFLFDGVPVEPA